MSKHWPVLALVVWKLVCPTGVYWGPYSTPENCNEVRAGILSACPIPRLKFVSPEVRDIFRQGCGTHNGTDCRCVAEDAGS